MTPIEAAISLSLKRLSNEELVATNNAAQTMDRVPPKNLAFDKLKSLRLIRDDGSLQDGSTFKAVCAYEVNRRVLDGTFV